MIKIGGNDSKMKKSISEGAENSKSTRKSVQVILESSSVSSNRNSSEEDAGGRRNLMRQENETVASRVDPLTKKLRGQVKELRHKVKALEGSIESRDQSLETISREKDRAMGEIRRLEKSNKQLRQQLNDERSHYLEEKERFCEEMTRCKRRLLETKANGGRKQAGGWNPSLPTSQQSLRWQFDREKGDFAEGKDVGLKSSKSQALTGETERKETNPFGRSLSCSDSQIRKTGSLESFRLYEGNDESLRMAALKTENAKLRSIICERDERNYELCLRFLRMKHCKNDIRTRFQDLESEYLQVITNLMEKIDEAREEFNFIIDQKFKKPLHSTNAMYLRLVQRNSRMAFENASLRVENQYLKKRLKKDSIEIDDCERKIDRASIPAEEISSYDSKSAEKLKRSKKNVNFKEIRTIYRRNLSLKNSDTDSNYISKTSTTVPSCGSLAEPRSNGNVVVGLGEESRGRNKAETVFQANNLPDEILNKIFRRVDTSSCQTVEGSRSKAVKFVVDAEAGDDEKDRKDVERRVRRRGVDKGRKVRGSTNGDASIRKETTTTTTTTTTKDVKLIATVKTQKSFRSKDSFGRPEVNNASSMLPYSPREFVDLSNRMGGLHPMEREAYLGWGRKGKEGDREGKETERFGGDSSSRWRRRFERREKIPVSSRGKKLPVRDSCALEERLEMSRRELPERKEVERRANGPGKDKAVVPADSCEDSSSITEMRSSLVSAVNAVSRPEPDVVRSRRPEGSKRFSHRLISTSPEQLRRILTESQFEDCCKMPPLTVGHASTEIQSGFRRLEGNSDIVLQLVIPAAKVGKPSCIFGSSEIAERETLEKETSTSGIGSSHPEKSPSFPEETIYTSDIRIPISDIPVSSSTIDLIVEEAAEDRSGIMLRTVSAPGLLESSWLDRFKVCEMKNCGTNT